jgi:hypothetical protein
MQEIIKQDQSILEEKLTKSEVIELVIEQTKQNLRQQNEEIDQQE